MKAKLFAFAVALFSAAIIGLVQLPSDAAQPGQVNGTARCSAQAIGARGSAFNVSGNTATVRFTVTGNKSCKVRLSANSFYAPTMNGKPYNKQTLFQRVTKVFTPGTYSMSVALPAKSTPAKGCFYQTDLTYGTSNVRPVLAYGHGKLDCSKPAPTPVAACNAITVTPLSRTSFRFNASASVKNGATIKSYTYTVKDSTGNQVATKTTTASSFVYTQNTPGTYTVKLTANTSVGAKTNTTTCEKQFSVTPEQKPGVSITKTVDGKKEETVALNQSFSYELTVANTGNIDLTNVAISDPAPEGIQFVGANIGMISDNSWSYTIPTLKVGESKSFTLTAKAVKELSGNVRNTACVDAPQVPGSPDSCDHADVNVPPKQPGKIVVCNPSTGKIISVDEDKEADFAPVNSEECKSAPAPTPTSLPVTGPAEVIFKMIGVGSLAGSIAYFVASRRML